MALCNVLAERYVLDAAPGAEKATLHDAHVPVASEAIAVVIAAVWVHGAHGVHLDMGVRADAGQLVAHGAINVTNAPLEIGYVPAESASNLVKYQLMATREDYSAVVPL